MSTTATRAARARAHVPGRVAASILGTVTIASAACGNANSTVGTSSSPGVAVHGSGGTVRIRAQDDWDTLNPATSNLTFLATQYMPYLYDRLVTIDPSGKIVPYLASSWTLAGTGDGITLTLKGGATCQDGTKITPAVVANSLTYLGAKATNAPYAYRDFGTAGYTVTGDDAKSTVTIKLNQPNSDLVSLGYLIVFGSVIAFTAYNWLLEHYSPTLLATHTYVNPIVAVLLGWLLAREVVTLNVLLSTAMVIVAVMLVDRGTTLLKKAA